MKRVGALLVLSGLVFSSVTLAGEAEDVARIKAMIAKELNGAVPTSVTRSPINGLYEVMVPPRVFYISGDGRYAFNGDILDLQEDINISERQRGLARKQVLDGLEESSMIVFAPKKVKHTISIFTDIDCGYCRKLHEEVKDYNDLGIKIRYMAYPRAGVGSNSYKKAVSVWCAADRAQAMTDAKAGKSVEDKDCPNPVAQQYQLGQVLGVTGTPSMVLSDGQIVPGYVPAKKLKEMLDQYVAQRK